MNGPISAATRKRRSGSGNGSGRSSTPLTTVNVATLAPIPSASVTIAAAVKRGFAQGARGVAQVLKTSWTRRTRRVSRHSSLRCSTPLIAQSATRAAQAVIPRAMCSSVNRST